MSDNQDHISGINYELLVDDSMRNVLRGALSIAEHVGLPGESHFFITFRTDYDGVCINQNLIKGGETELTIVIQHQFWDLKVEEAQFSVTLSFSGKPETLVIPFAAVTQFSDPSVGFGLQFGAFEEIAEEAVQALQALPHEEDKSDESAEIVSLDSFRNRPKPE
ncbi:MAG: SspB family protein [Candidatus Puniceispirillaceae bacterium]